MCAPGMGAGYWLEVPSHEDNSSQERREWDELFEDIDCENPGLFHFLAGGVSAVAEAVKRSPGGRFSPDLEAGAAWCPYCGGVREFAWDAACSVSRCPSCGASSEDFWVRVCNSGAVRVGRAEHRGLCSDAGKARFDATVRGSGRRPARILKPKQPGPEPEADAPAPRRRVPGVVY
ncbi:MAG TPA: hypothetical protein DCE07_05160 [Peptococcaceae bacterium]|nr:hypothetical protein [Peptococcaceae bacterium]